jgi:hypothetical protein
MSFLAIKYQPGALRGPRFLALMADEIGYLKGDAVLVI